MSIKVCSAEVIAAVKKKKGADISLEEAETIVETLNDWLKKHKGSVGEDTIAKLALRAKEFAINSKIAAKIEKRNALINGRIYSKIATKLRENPKNPQAVLAGMLVGDAKNRLSSVDAMGHAIMVDYAGNLAASLQKQNLVKIFTSGAIDEKIYAELFDGLGSSGDANAKSIAMIIRKQQKSILDRKNRAGANIGEIENYVIRQMHDSLLMIGNIKNIKQSKAEWITFTEGLLDIEKSTINKPVNEDVSTYLGKIYDNLVSGNHTKTTNLDTIEGLNYFKTGFKGPKNLAKSLSGARVLHFKDGASSFKYAKKYSRMTLAEGVLSGFTHDAQSIALLETFGTNPKNMFEKVLDDVRNTKDPVILQKFNEGLLKNYFAELDGTTRQKGIAKNFLGFDVSFAGIAAGVRMIQNMAKLGFATISSFSDISTKAAYINANTERGVFASYGRAFMDVLEGFQGAERKELGYLLLVGVENFLNDVHARFGANDSGPGKIAKAHNLYFRLNGMQWWNNAQKTGLARMLAADLANYSSKSFDKIPKETQRLLKLYDVTEREWSLFKNITGKAADNRNYVIPGMVDNLTNDLIDPIIRDAEGKLDITDKMRQKFKDDLRTKVAMYYADSADAAIPTPGARERAIMNVGTKRGTVLGEALRAIMQLKGFPITYVTKGLARQKASAGMYGVTKMMVGSTVMGYLSITLKDILKGKEPRDVFLGDGDFNTKLLQQAFLQGGGAGIYGDFLFNEYNRYGRSFAETLGGPNVAAINDIAVMMSQAVRGDVPTQRALRFAIQNTPYLNLFYTKLALDYLFINDLQELAKPGFLRDMQYKLQKDFEQEYYIPPSQTSRIVR